ncbi:MAG: hypothetical protein E7E64_05290 [Clostridium celatum]|uniref:hypothetical protein n=1 Tax=Clostridium tertium TaxID=1559 RepID=UPI0028FED473|nr:hypothetical protein [Clostridium celatum]
MEIKLKLSLINCGFITPYLAKQHLKISDKVLNSLVKKNELEKNINVIFGKLNYIYTLSDISLKRFRNEGFYIYKHDSNQLEHDYILQCIFLSISDKEKLTWQNETSLKHKFGKNISTSDAIYIKDNKIIGVEVLTPNYTKDVINSKMQFITKICDESFILHTKDFNGGKIGNV